MARSSLRPTSGQEVVLKTEFKWKPLNVSVPPTYAGAVDLVVVPVYEDEFMQLSNRIRLPGRIYEKATNRHFTGQAGKVVELANDKKPQIHLLGLGKRPGDSHSSRQHMHVAGLCTKHAIDRQMRSVRILTHASSLERARVMVKNMTIGVNLALPRCTQKTRGEDGYRLDTVELCFYNEQQPVLPFIDAQGSDYMRTQAAFVADATMLARAVRLARHWVDLGPNQKVPALFADMVTAEYERARGDVPIERHPRFSLDIMEEDVLRQRGMNLILAVGGCHHKDHNVLESHRPRLVHFSVLATKQNPSKKPLVFVLKGVTFDSGGLQIKPADGMQNMKIDMAAAAAGLSLMGYLMQVRGLDRDVHIIVPFVENMIGQGAMRPGDVYESMSGATVEIGHTDAEGRLILADGIHFGQEIAGGPDLVSTATLTGAQMVALGNTAALYANDPELEAQFLCAALDAGESFHPMPLDPSTVPPNKSDIADVRNLATGRDGGSITAALFLKEFVRDGTRWLHVDLAGPVWQDGKPRFGFINEGPTGFGVLTMAQFIETHCVAKG